MLATRRAYRSICLCILLCFLLPAMTVSCDRGAGQAVLAAPETVPAVPAGPEKGTTGNGGGVMQITSSAFRNGETIPKKHTGDGPDVSPPLEWTGAPPAAKSFAVICDDPDAPMGTWVHWIIWNIPPSATGLPEGVPKNRDLPDGSRQGRTDFKRIGYNGPAPPPGPAHRYFFKVFALDTEIALTAGADKAELVKAMENHILAQAELMGRYKR